MTNFSVDMSIIMIIVTLVSTWRNWNSKQNTAIANKLLGQGRSPMAFKNRRKYSKHLWLCFFAMVFFGAYILPSLGGWFFGSIGYVLIGFGIHEVIRRRKIRTAAFDDATTTVTSLSKTMEFGAIDFIYRAARVVLAILVIVITLAR
jgi:signal transduction histidine kinase